ncbi:MAG: hypothetical protein QOF66_2183 [Mycobacterium sp.]|jgi:hypothetical protein|nr:hypothetical protein [Mycobacterium sp.]
MAFVLAVRSFARWPVDAFVTHIDTSKEVQTIYWIQGNAIGRLTATGSGDTPTLSAAVHSLSSPASVDLGGTIVDERLGPPEVRRSASLRFGDGDEIAVDAAACTNQHCRDALTSSSTVCSMRSPSMRSYSQETMGTTTLTTSLVGPPSVGILGGGSGWRAEHIVRRSSLWFGSPLESPVQSSQRQTRGATKGATSGVALGPLEPHQHDCPRDHPYRSYRPADRDGLLLDRIWQPLREPEGEGLQGRAAFRGSARRASVRSSCELLCTHPVTSARHPSKDDGPTTEDALSAQVAALAPRRDRDSLGTGGILATPGGTD